MAVEKNVTKAKELYHYTCDELGFPDSCFALGNIYLTHKSKDVNTCSTVVLPFTPQVTSNFSSPYHYLVKHASHENNGNDHQG